MLALLLNAVIKIVPKSYVSIGGNINKDIYIPAGLKALKKLFGDLIISSVYESEPVGFLGESFYNLVIAFDTDSAVTNIAQQLRDIESDNGRIRNTEKFSSHTLDLDLILYGDLITDTNNGLHIPRKEIEQYAFVLEPLAEIAPTLQHPISLISYEKMWEKFDKTDLKQQRVKPIWSTS